MNTLEIKSFKFHKNFVGTYRGLSVIQTRRKLKRYYTHSEQNAIIRYLTTNNII